MACSDAFGDHPAAGEQQRLAFRGQREQVPDQVVAGSGTVDPDQDVPPPPGRDLLQRPVQHFLVIGEGIRAGVAGAQQHVQALAGVHAPGRQRVEAEALLPGGSCPGLV
jgi:hypothetical protein